eukprot:TRINITY_DN7690_c0_g1_i4.p1 TRINITY_DN7690_c0_g1~~TRINITY_DN7690_c0_g1_i4.p1  ORF type:complete len:168 (+),score=74.30 TRINITY_DN7690_c0_g1_i4:126-629(+)
MGIMEQKKESDQEPKKAEISLKEGGQMSESEKMLLRKKRFAAEATTVPTSQVDGAMKAEEDKRRARAERFGITSLEEKLKARAKKFGVVSEEDKKAERLKRFKALDSSEGESAKMAARAQRFGIPSNNKETGEPEKMKARAERFGLKTDDEKMKKRLEKFGKLSTSP